tara:strand:- start:2044 stop:4200 length:2157 start_codon:yes stop_codon:yes gene_type:complete
MKKKSIGVVGVAISGACWGILANAQDLETASSNRERAIEEVVVLATRREESLQDVPVTVTSASGTMLSQAGVEDVRSLAQVIPSYTGGRFQQVMQPSIRGVGSSGTSVGDESNVAVYVDGVYQGDPYSTQIDLVEVSRVEVLRGPQGTSFGRNATGGLINVITPDPSYDFNGRVALKGSSIDNEGGSEFEVKTYVTGPVSDRIAFDLAGMYRDTGGYVSDIGNGGELADAEKLFIRSKLMVEPAENSKIVLTVGYVDFKEDGAYQQPFEGNSAGAAFPGAIIAAEPWSTSNETAGKHEYDRLDVALQTSFLFDKVELQTTSSYMDTSVHQIADSDGTNIELGWTDMRVEPETFNQEIRLLSATDDALQWSTGVYYYHLKGRQPLDVLNNPTNDPSVTSIQLDPRSETNSYSGYVELNYAWTDKLDIAIGGRYTDEEREFSQYVNGMQLPYGDLSATFDEFTYSLKLSYSASSSVLLYGSYGTGFKSGLYNTLGTSPEPVEPETIAAFEVGMKADPTYWLRTNVALYYYEYEDMQVNSRADDNQMRLQNAADSEIYGAEIEAIAYPLDDLAIRASYSYVNATFDHFPAAQVFVPRETGGNQVLSMDVSGNDLVRTPEHSAILGMNYGFNLGGGRAHIASNLFWSDEVFYDFLNEVKQDSYAMLSAELGWSTADDKWTFKLYANNLTNEEVAQHIAPGPLATYITYERPRTIGLGLETRF